MVVYVVQDRVIGYHIKWCFGPKDDPRLTFEVNEQCSVSSCVSAPFPSCTAIVRLRVYVRYDMYPHLGAIAPSIWHLVSVAAVDKFGIRAISWNQHQEILRNCHSVSRSNLVTILTTRGKRPIRTNVFQFLLSFTSFLRSGGNVTLFCARESILIV